jgi:hypothetical protein
MMQGKWAGDNTTRGSGGQRETSRWWTKWDNLAASNARQYGGGQRDKRRGVEDTTQDYRAVDDTTREGTATL